MNLRSKNCSKNKHQIFWGCITVNRDKMEVHYRINSYSVICKLCVTYIANFEANRAKQVKLLHWAVIPHQAIGNSVCYTAWKSSNGDSGNVEAIATVYFSKLWYSLAVNSMICNCVYSRKLHFNNFMCIYA